MMISSRKNETTGVLNRDILEYPVNGVSRKEWDSFRECYHKAAGLNDNGYPIQIDISLNSGCNMRCPFCWHGAKKIPNDLMPEETFKKIINEAVQLGTKSLKLNYINEPLLHPKLGELIEYAKNAGMINIFLSTNGILLTPEKSREIIKSGITKVFVSIDAYTEETYNKQRKSGKYLAIIQNVLDFIEARKATGNPYPFIRVNFLRNKINEHEEHSFINFWKDKVDMVAVQTMNNLPDKDSDIFINIFRNDYKCSFPFKQLVINTNGDILPCCTMYGSMLKLGNINDMTLKQAWDSPKMIELKDIHKRGAYKNKAVCRRCIDG